MEGKESTGTLHKLERRVYDTCNSESENVCHVCHVEGFGAYVCHIMPEWCLVLADSDKVLFWIELGRLEGTIKSR